MEILLTLGYSGLFLFLVYRLRFFRIDGLPKNALGVVFILKVIAGVSLYMVYSYYYKDRSTADIFRYFDDSKVMYDALFTNPGDFFQMLFGFGNDSPHFSQYYNQMNNWYRVYESNMYNDSHTIIRLNAVLRFFSFGYYNVHTVFMCFICLAGLVGIYRFFYKFLIDRPKELFIAVFLLPSVMFWGSGVLKEGLLLFGMGIMLYFSDRLILGKDIIISISWILLSSILLLYTKFYIFVIIFPLIIGWLWCRKTGFRRAAIKFAAVLVMYIFIGLNIHHLFPQFDMIMILVQKQHDFINLAQSVNSGSSIDMRPLEPNAWSLLINMPRALYNSLLRPFIFESRNPMMIIAAAENIFLILFALLCLIYSRFRVVNKALFSLTLLFVLGVFVLTGLITPVIGAIVRYKVPALPFFAIMFIMLLDKRRFLKRFSFLDRYLRHNE